jgi:hypothetical protein
VRAAEKAGPLGTRAWANADPVPHHGKDTMNRLLRTSVAAIAATSLGLVLATGAPAGATAARIVPRGVPARPHAGHSPNNSSSTGFAGYQVTGLTAATSVSSSFRVPALTGCTAGVNQGIASGVQIFNSTDFSAAAIFEFCGGATGTTPSYLADVIINGTEADYAITINPGDRVAVSITESTTSTTVKVTDSTSHKSATATVSVGDTMTGAASGDTALNFGATQAGVPTFTRIAFSLNKLNGAALTTFSPTAVDMATVGPPPVLQIQTGTLSAASAFTTTFKHN